MRQIQHAPDLLNNFVFWNFCLLNLSGIPATCCVETNTTLQLLLFLVIYAKYLYPTTIPLILYMSFHHYLSSQVSILIHWEPNIYSLYNHVMNGSKVKRGLSPFIVTSDVDFNSCTSIHLKVNSDSNLAVPLKSEPRL